MKDPAGKVFGPEPYAAALVLPTPPFPDVTTRTFAFDMMVLYQSHEPIWLTICIPSLCEGSGLWPPNASRRR